jgi:ubiquinol-cytochrome c reductase cytochrome b subunit
MFNLHYLLPFLLIVLTFVHFYFLHEIGSSNVLNIDGKTESLSLYPYFWLADV